MKISTEEIADREVALTLEPEPERVAKASRSVARQLAKRVKIPGFRPGKAPFQVVERTVGREYLLEEVASELATDLYKEALDETGLDPYTQAGFEILSLDPMSLKVTVALVPEVVLGDYHAIHVEPADEVVVTAEQVDEALQEVQETLSEWDPVERAAQMGDQVIIGVTGNKGDEVVADSQEEEFVLSEDGSPPGFSAQIVGIETGESKDFSITYPDDFPDEELRGQEVAFKVTLQGVREKQVPALDDELAKSAGDYETLEDLKQALREGIQRRLEEEARDRLAEEVVKALVEQATVTYPAVALEHEVDEMLSSYEKRLEGRGFTLDSYLGMIGQSREELREEFEPGAKERLTRSLVLAELVKAEDIKVEDNDLEEEVERIASSYGDRAAVAKRAITQANVLNSIASDLYTKRAVDRMIAIATGQTPEEDAAGEEPALVTEAKPADEETVAEDQESVEESAEPVTEASSPESEAGAPEDAESAELAETDG